MSPPIWTSTICSGNSGNWRSVNPRQHYRKSDHACKKLYNESHSRDESGLDPKLNGRLIIGISQHLACKRATQMERHFQTNPNLKKEYAAFMKQYIVISGILTGFHLRKSIQQPQTYAAFHITWSLKRTVRPQ